MSHQQSAKHGPAVDDALTNPRRQSSGGTHHRERPEEDPTGQTVADDVGLCSELARFLEPSAFPANVAELRELAERHDVTDTVLALLDGGPHDGSVFHTVEELWEALSG
jgi:hypothetical protein